MSGRSVRDVEKRHQMVITETSENVYQTFQKQKIHKLGRIYEYSARRISKDPARRMHNDFARRMSNDPACRMTIHSAFARTIEIRNLTRDGSV